MGWVLFGIALEAAHGFKVAAYLDDGLRRTLLRLAHAHGVILALVVLAAGRTGLAGAPNDAGRAAGRLIRAGALIVPLGFATGAIAPHEGDPGLPVVLVPLGAALLLFGLGRIALDEWRRGR